MNHFKDEEQNRSLFHLETVNFNLELTSFFSLNKIRSDFTEMRQLKI